MSVHRTFFNILFFRVTGIEHETDFSQIREILQHLCPVWLTDHEWGFAPAEVQSKISEAVGGDYRAHEWTE